MAEASELIARDDVEAVVVATPTPFHFPHAREAVERGKHVFLELPMVRREEEGEELVALVKQKGVVLTVNHLQRFYQDYELIREKVREGAVGKPGMIRLGRRTPHPLKWYSNFESSGGVILDSMIHELDYLMWVFGPVKRVFCRSLHGRYSTERLDYALASLRLESGAIAHIESSWCHYGQFNLDVEIAGDKGLIRHDNQDSIPLKISYIDWEQKGRRYFSESPVILPAYYKVLDAFVKAIEGKGENPVPPEEGLRAVRLALAALRSAETNQPVSFTQAAA